jgi:hypothetical protein
MKKSSGVSWRVLGTVAALGLTLGLCRVAQGQAPCIGDCNDSGEVAVDDIIIMVNIALGIDTIESCINGDANCDGEITIDDITKAIGNALIAPQCLRLECPEEENCGDGAVGPGEECDDGGVCTGGAMAGTACTSEADCGGEAQPGICLGGPNLGKVCSTANDCPGSECRRCKAFGGDGCAANCTTESDVTFSLVAGEVQGNAIKPGTSGATVYGEVIPVLPLPLTGSQVLTIGKKRDNLIPVVIKAASVQFPAIPVSTIACACVRGANAKTCGGTVLNADGSQTLNCTLNESVCNGTGKPCSTVHGDGNSASGFIGCAGLEPVNVNITQDCNGTAGGEPSPPVVVVEGSGPAGSAIILNTIQIGTMVGACTPTFCTDADPPASRGTPQTLPYTTANASAEVLNANDFEGFNIGPEEQDGSPFTCTEPNNPDSGTISSVTGVTLAGAFTACDQPTIADIVVTNGLVGQ